MIVATASGFTIIKFVGERNIKSLHTTCDNSTNGCEWFGELGAIDKHLSDCGYVRLPCPNECGDGDTTCISDDIFHILRKDLEVHVSEECPRREYECPHCLDIGEYHEMTTTHLEECDYIEIPCPNEGCYERVERRLIINHCTNSCEFEIVPCQYITIGCERLMIRKDIEEHENDDQYHLQYTIDAVCEQKVTVRNVDCSVMELYELVDEKVSIKSYDPTIRVLQEKIEKQENVLAHLHSVVQSQSKKIFQLTSQLDERESKTLLCSKAPADTSFSQKFVFKFTNFSERKSSKEAVYTPPLYSSPGGYKMCFKVIANGSASGKGSHVSVYAYLMRGENDNHLSWPFTGIVVIELLNQLEDRNHLLIDPHFNEDDDVSQQVVNSDKAKLGRGRQRFIRHSLLGFDSAANCQYLKDDCLYFRFEIECTSTTKPWLSSANVF